MRIQYSSAAYIWFCIILFTREGNGVCELDCDAWRSLLQGKTSTVPVHSDESTKHRCVSMEVEERNDHRIRSIIGELGLSIRFLNKKCGNLSCEYSLTLGWF